ncbi:hypothetical protein IMG5_154100 [Ichthyophthirius multifiliis]|uniref:Uncharacterized protein n=1 Tax=Ichthyophthirius multifiliis TaxID=5932 RepID=G0QZ36_ICHMU|nr:hypothetical protein IMG5_154100 [Ichthyophthirius multifiliis]EGR29522.1 hypothetical protein IMG5_154100 [Ichthyophthirius multifiliis]|eukprot:XP_004030758.1 hypothetical protein IMG5_154100 [Ichthyophthirius multifiliis]
MLINGYDSIDDLEDQVLNLMLQSDQFEKQIKDHLEYYQSSNVSTIVSNFNTSFAKIQQFSENTPNFFGYKKEHFQNISSLNELIPDYISIWHDKFILRLIETGKTKIMRKYRNIVAKCNGIFIILLLF